MTEIWTLLTIFMLACFVGYFIIWGVTPALHSPLMSISNAISGIIILGAVLSLQNTASLEAEILSYTAIFLASVNIFGGFAVSQRMLGMFKTKEEQK